MLWEFLEIKIFWENVNFYQWSDFGVLLEKLIQHSRLSMYVLVIETECGWDPVCGII